MKDIEVEIQVRVENVSKLADFLEREGRFVAEEYQKDEYYTPVHRNFIAEKPVDEWLRLRTSDEYTSVTYKNWHQRAGGGKTSYCDEYETRVDDVDSLRKIFEVLDFKELTIVEKKRKIWLYKDWEFAIDTVQNLGDFVELEYKGKKDVDSDAETGKMVQFLKDIGCGKVERNWVGYPYLLMFNNENNFEVV